MWQRGQVRQGSGVYDNISCNLGKEGIAHTNSASGVVRRLRRWRLPRRWSTAQGAGIVRAHVVHVQLDRGDSVFIVAGISTAWVEWDCCGEWDGGAGGLWLL